MESISKRDVLKGAVSLNDHDRHEAIEHKRYYPLVTCTKSQSKEQAAMSRPTTNPKDTGRNPAGYGMLSARWPNLR
jgi:hypothetical protein